LLADSSRAFVREAAEAACVAAARDGGYRVGGQSNLNSGKLFFGRQPECEREFAVQFSYNQLARRANAIPGTLSAATLLVLAGGVQDAIATVTVSSAATQNIDCSGGVCSPTATNAVLNVADLETLLASGNIAVTTTGSGGIQAGNITVDAPASWSNASVLALDAYQSIAIDRKVSVGGTGGLALTFNDDGTSGVLDFGGPGRVVFANLASPLSINGASYSLVNSIASLAGAIASNPSGNYALAKPYNASGDGTYASAPISTSFLGNFSGLGNAISNLSINNPASGAYVGLFASIGSSATLRDIRLLNANIAGAGASGSAEYIGALVGYDTGGLVADAAAGGTVAGGSDSEVGGLVGVSKGMIAMSSATTNVSSNGGECAGGLVGLDEGTVAGAHSSGAVSGSAMVAGGLAGCISSAAITNSSATGAATSTYPYAILGGLVGNAQQGNIAASYATGNLSGGAYAGGLTGVANLGTISQSYATGTVGAEDAGGLVGLNQGTISQSYAMGAVAGGTRAAGGLIGTNAAPSPSGVTQTYSTGSVTGPSGATGGLVGTDTMSGSIQDSYWDTDTSGITNLSQGAGNVANDPGIAGLTTAQFQSGLPAGFDSTVWAEKRRLINGLPYLLANRPPR